MNFNNSILVISDNDEKTEILKSKLVLLRDVDTITQLHFDVAQNSIIEEIPDTIIIFTTQNSDIETLLKKLKADQFLKSVPILLINNEYNEDMFLSAYDLGISDFLTCEATDAEILMRVIWCLQKNEIQTKFETQNELLIELGVLDKDLQIYTQNYTSKVFENEILNFKKHKKVASLMAISADISSKNKLTPTLLASIIKKSIRNSDIVGFADNDIFYLLLPKTNTQGIFAVYQRIKNNIGEEYSISVGASELKNLDYKSTQKAVDVALNEAINLGNYIIIADKATSQNQSDWIEDITSNQKNFKLFKQAFAKKLENVIVPVFFQLQKINEPKLFDAKIEQFTNENMSLFSIVKSPFESNFKITYPGFSKINIDITHFNGKNNDSDRLTLDLVELNEQKLIELLEQFIKNFKIKSEIKN